MRRFFASVHNEQHKFLTWKKFGLFMIIIVVFAIVFMPIYDVITKNSHEQFEDNHYIHDAEINYQDAVSHLNSLSPDSRDYNYYKYKVLYYKKILDTHQVPDILSYRNRGDYLEAANTLLFVNILFGVVVVFSCLIITREYSSKNILPLFTSPSTRTSTFGAKFLLMSLFCLVSTTLFFIILGLTSLKYNGTGQIAVYFTNSIEFVSYPVAYTVAACLTFVASIMIGSITMFLGTLIKNVYVTLPITFGGIVALIFTNMQVHQPSIFPLFNTDYSMYFYRVNSGSLSSIPNPPWAFFLINIVTIIVMGVLGCLVFSKRQVKE